MPEKFAPNANLVTSEYIEFYANLYKTSFDIKKVESLANDIQLPLHFLDFKIGQCSKGTIQKIGVLSCLYVDAQVIIMDEPTTGLDIISRYSLKAILHKYSKEKTIKENPNLKMILQNDFDDVDFLDSKNVIKKAVQKKQDILQQFYKSDVPNLEKNHNIDIIQSSSLAELMVCRFITLADAYKKCNDKDVLEKDIHNLLFTQRANSDSVKNNNLWLLDARWQYSKHIESDNSINDIFQNLTIEELYERHNLTLTDDERANIKKSISQALNSELIEEKSYKYFQH
jgi:ABC-type multidrug transport system ATPase subunit